MTVNVFIVDDSATARTALRLILETSDDINVIGVASTPVIALKRMQKVWPDVIISDLEMPDMSGIEFLDYLKKHHPTPFIVFSNYTGSSAMSSVEALAKGAVDIIPKPNFNCAESLQATSLHILNSVRAAAKLAAKMEVERLQKRQVIEKTAGASDKHFTRSLLGMNKPKLSSESEPVVRSEPLLPRAEFSVLALGSSTGGTTIVEKVLRSLGPKSPPALVVQHMPEHFTQAFANRINQFCEIDVKEAEDGDELRPGLALIAPGGRHMKLVQQGSQMRISIFDGEVVNSHKPSVDVLFDSLAHLVQRDALGVILTGMGKDGARGLLAMRNAGALTISQTAEDCAVNGMPKAAMALDAVDLELTSMDIADALSAVSRRS